MTTNPEMTNDQLFEERVASWPVLSMPSEEQVKYLTESLTNLVIGIFDDNNAVYSITVPKGLGDSVKAFLHDLVYPADHQAMQDADLSDYLNANLHKLATNIPVIELEVSQFKVPNLENLGHVSNDQFFIRIETFKGIEDRTLRQWDEKLQISGTLAKQGIFIRSEDLKQAYVFFNIMNLMEEYRNNQIQIAPAGVPKLR